MHQYSEHRTSKSSQLKASGKQPFNRGKFLEDNRRDTVQQKPNNTGLPDQLKSGIENLSGHSMDDVKVHYNFSKPAQLNAHAYAQGNQIHLATGQEKHLAHEAWHIVQQKQGRVKPTMQLKGSVPVNDDAELEKGFNGTVIQQKPATATGSTHLVEMNHESIMEGKQGAFIKSRTPLDVDPNKRVISRRGSNQELVGDYDKRGEHIYRWYKIDGYGAHDISKKNEYIREGTFKFDSSLSKPEVSHLGLDQHSEYRTRKSHIAVRFDVWYNSDKNVDGTGHLVMDDYSADHRHKPPMYEYTWGDAKEIDTTENKEKFPFVMTGDKAESEVTNKHTSGIGPNSSTHKVLLQHHESREEKQERMKGQFRYHNPKDGNPNRYTMGKLNATESVKRFNKVKSAELLVTMDEYNYLMKMFEARKKGGFYCFYREARTVHDYALATRCLSFLEDVAIKRKQTTLKPGHAEEVLTQFATLNKITKAHQREGNV